MLSTCIEDKRENCEEIMLDHSRDFLIHILGYRFLDYCKERNWLNLNKSEEYFEKYSTCINQTFLNKNKDLKEYCVNVLKRDLKRKDKK